MKRIAVLLALGFLAIGTANASIIPVLLTGPVPDGLNFDYTYQADLSGDERLDPAATNGVTCFGSLCNPPGTFFTIYDIPGFVSAAVSAAGWGVSIQLTGLTPSSISAPDGGLVNVTFTYTGPVVHANGTTVDFTGFTVVSTENGLTNGVFSSQATKDGIALSGLPDPTNGLTDQVVGPVSVPSGPSNPTPEPVSLVLLGSGLLGIGSVARKKLRA
jgi:hypothetical protein